MVFITLCYRYPLIRLYDMRRHIVLFVLNISLHDDRPLGVADSLSGGRTVLPRPVHSGGMIIALAASSLGAVLPARVANRVAFCCEQVAVVAAQGLGH